MKAPQMLIPTLRPDHTLLWLPASIVAAFGIASSAGTPQLTPEQFESTTVQELLAQRRTTKGNTP